MVIEYQVERTDLVKAYFYNIRHSLRTRLLVFGAAILLSGCILAGEFLPGQRGLTLRGFIVAISYVLLAMFVFMPAAIMLLAKTGRRILSITQDGIEVQRGALKAKIPWTFVETVQVTDELILITGKSTNALTIPKKTFTSEEHLNEFVRLAREYHSSATEATKGTQN